jgi:hypothetical protein
LITLYSLYLLTFFLIYKLGYELLEKIKNIFLLNIKNNRVSINLILGLFFLNFLALILNFFTALNDYLLLTVLFLLLLILILRINRRDIKLLIIFAALIIFTIPMIMNHDIGHDAGLYHVPFQNWIKNYKITFGLYNLHSRYALNTSYDYISSLFWIGDNFTVVSFFQAIYLNIFILFLYELSKEKNNFSVLLILPTTLSFLLWLRYSNIDYGGVDFSFGILAILFCFQTLILLNSNETKFNNSNFWIYILIFCSVVIAKPTGIVFLVLFLFLLFYFYFYKNFMMLKSKQLNFILIITILMLAWFIKNFIISGCFLYPVKYSCLEVSWFNLNYLIRDLLLIQQYKRHFVDINFTFIFENFYFLIILFLFVIFLLFFFIKKINQKLSILLFFLFTLLIFFNFSFDSLKGFTSISSSGIQINNIKISNQIIMREVKRIITIYSLLCLCIICLWRYFITKKQIYKFNIKNFTIFLFFFLLFTQWYSLSPDPRLGFWLIAVLPTLFLASFLNINNLRINSRVNSGKISKINFGILIVNLFILFISQVTQLNTSNFNFFSYNRILVNETVFKQRIRFGYTPINHKIDNGLVDYTWNFCWNIKDCYYNEDEMILSSYFLNYKIIERP